MSTTQLAIPIVAKSIGNKMKVEVKYGHAQPATDGNVIYLPDLPLDDDKTRALGLGFVVHEAGHIRFTTFNVGDPVSPLHKHIRNIFEDIRMEKEIINLYPGAKKVLCELVELLVDDDFFDTEGQTPARVLSRYMLYTLRSSVLGQFALLPLAKASSSDLDGLVSSGAMTRVHSVMSQVIVAKSTLDVHNLALEIISILEDDVKPPEENEDEQKDNEEDSNDTNDNDEQEQSEAGDNDDQLSASGNDGSSDDSDDNAQQEASPDSSNAKAIQEMLDASEDDLDKDLFDAVSDELGDAVDEAVKNGAVCSDDGLADEPPLPLGDHSEVYAQTYEQTYALRNRLQSFMQASKRVKKGTSRHGFKLNGRKLHRVKTGNTSIYQTKQRKRAVNTVVQVLMDRSASMNGMMGLATNATLAVASALESIPGVRVAACAFPGRNAAVEPMTLLGESVKQTAARYPAIAASGGTPLIPALMWSTQQLLGCSEERKLLLVVTDGEPFDMQECKKMIAQMRTNKIETMGLGIMVSSVNDLFEISRCISSKEELAGAMFSMLQENLVNPA